MAIALEQQTYELFINGESVKPQSSNYTDIVNPSTNKPIARVAAAGIHDADAAVASSRAALEGKWATMPPARRARVLFKIANILSERIDDIAKTEVLNTGKTLAGAKGEINQIIELFEFYGGAVTKLMGSTMPSLPGYFNYTVKEPVGVCAQIVPWNYPLLMAGWKVAPAIAAGNAVILKPASPTPLTALMLGQICLEAGCLPGVVNVLPGPGATVGSYLAGHPGVDKIAFTGETKTGATIMEIASATIKRVTLELGGKSPSLVFDDADIDAAVAGAVYGIFHNAGQSCDARSRILVHESVKDAFTAKFVEKAKSLRVGDPMDPKTQIGAIISRSQLEKIEGYVGIGSQEGAVVACGGQRPEGELRAGNFLLPTVLDKVRNDMRVAQEEIFGPVFCILPYDTEEDAIRIANDTVYGLAASVWTQNAGRAHRVAHAIRAGGVAINTPFSIHPGMPFGGYKQSGFGRELALQTLDLYTETKGVVMYTGTKAVNPLGV